MNVVTSGARPFSLASLQVLSKSLAGQAISVLDGRTCLMLSSGLCMVMLSSIKQWYPSLLDMVATSKWEVRWTFRNELIELSSKAGQDQDMKFEQIHMVKVVLILWVDWGFQEASDQHGHSFVFHTVQSQATLCWWAMLDIIMVAEHSVEIKGKDSSSSNTLSVDQNHKQFERLSDSKFSRSCMLEIYRLEANVNRLVNCPVIFVQVTKCNYNWLLYGLS